jgi:hypothetical protein
MKEVDGLLGENALMLGRWALYSRFISDKCAVSLSLISMFHPLMRIALST